MKRPFWAAMIVALAGTAAGPALADRDHHRGERHHHKQHHRHEHRAQPRHAYCPPGLIQEGRACIPPGYKLTRKRQHPRVGEMLHAGDYRRIDDPRLYALQPQQNWNYYRDDNNIYRVDKSTRKILAVMEMISAFSN